MLRQTMLLDPPWNERGGGKSKRGADRHYPVMKTPAILKLIVRSEFWTPDPRRCSVWMWATANYLGEAIWLMGKLGATYVTNVVWVKSERKTVDILIPTGQPAVYKNEMTDVVIPQAPGLGQRVRMCHEHLLFGRIGHVLVPKPSDRLPSVIYAPRTKHSVKPDEAFDLIERHDGQGNRLEWFARRHRPGWNAWGNEVGSKPTENIVESEQLDVWSSL